MQSTFTLIRPPAVAAPFRQAVAELRALPLTLDTESLPLLEARLLCGDFEAVARLLADAAPHPALPLAAARLHDWTGDLRILSTLFPAIRASLDLVHGHPELQASWAALQRAATDFGDAPLSASLARLARNAVQTPAAPASGPAGYVLSAARQLFGPGPDAFRGRITLAPRLGAHDTIAVRDLRFADGALSLTVERTPHAASYTIEQETGPTPFTVLLEPIVESVTSAQVDGRPAHLDVRPVTGGVTAPVQLVLDDVRTVVLR